jgi:hypothetical protein
MLSADERRLAIESATLVTGAVEGHVRPVR